MGTAIAIVGLPGSGKTTYAQKLAAEIGAHLVDDPTDLTYIKSLAELNKTIIITDPHFCIDVVRTSATKQLAALGYNIEWIFFENNPIQCIENAASRPDKNVKNDIKFFSKNYIIPKDAVVIPVWCPNV